MADYGDTCWPWRITVTRADGTSDTDNYSGNYGGRPVTEYAAYMSRQDGVTRVDVSTTFAAGEQVNPGSDLARGEPESPLVEAARHAVALGEPV